LRFSIALLLAAGCFVPVETTWSAFARADELPPLPSSPSSDAVSSPPSGSPPAASAPAQPRAVTVHVVTNAAALQVLFRPASATSPPSSSALADFRPYTASCMAPCDLQLPPGDYVVALSRAGGKAYEEATPLALRTATTIDATYDSHSSIRVTGAVFLSTFVPVGLLLALVGATSGTETCTNGLGANQCSTTPETGIVAAGVVSIGIGLVLGTAFLLQHDQSSVQVVSAPGPLATPGGPSERAAGANGLALRFAF
jgi:hypothetical protein